MLMACAPVQLAHTTAPECCAQHKLRWNGLLHGSWPPGRSEGRPREWGRHHAVARTCVRVSTAPVALPNG